MLEGVDYYPKKRKRLKSKAWLLLAMLMLSATLYYLYEQNQAPKQVPSSGKQIVVSEPTTTVEIPLEVSDVAPKLRDNKTLVVPKVESLDKVIEIYHQQQ